MSCGVEFFLLSNVSNLWRSTVATRHPSIFHWGCCRSHCCGWGAVFVRAVRPACTQGCSSGPAGGAGARGALCPTGLQEKGLAVTLQHIICRQVLRSTCLGTWLRSGCEQDDISVSSVCVDFSTRWEKCSDAFCVPGYPLDFCAITQDYLETAVFSNVYFYSLCACMFPAVWVNGWLIWKSVLQKIFASPKALSQTTWSKWKGSL